MNILYEDKNIIVCQKNVGELSEASRTQSSLANQIENTYGYAGVIHRLDLNVGGAIVYAKNKSSAAYFSRLVQEKMLSKEYLAVVHGVPDEPGGEFFDYLFKDSSKNKVFVVKKERKGVKSASLHYKLIRTVYEDGKPLSLVLVKLNTGRSHQIRVQFASRKMPLVGDGKYGSKSNKCQVALWSFRLMFPPQKSAESLTVTSLPPQSEYPWSLFELSGDL